MHSQSDEVASTLRDTVSIAKRCLITEELSYLHASIAECSTRAFVFKTPRQPKNSAKNRLGHFFKNIIAIFLKILLCKPHEFCVVAAWLFLVCV
jgi:hypothetical protein